MIEAKRPGQEIDRRNGFPIVWKQLGKNGGGYYSLVRVPVSRPIRLAYAKPNSGIRVNFTPTSASSFWLAQGIVGSDTLANLGMPVSQRRREKTQSTVVTESDLERMRERYGEAHSLPNVSTRFAIKLILPLSNVYYFLGKVWKPMRSAQEMLDNIPPYRLNGPENFRVLPQKIIPSGNRQEFATLQVEKLP